MKDTAYIWLKSGAVEVRFDWLQFDGDDCFNDFHTTAIAAGNNPRRFDFDPCAVFGLREVSRFFSDATQSTVSGGFRHPDIRYYEIHRSGKDYRLVIRFEGSGMQEECVVQSPLVQIDSEFLKDYNGES